ncbi:MAG: phosphatidate cytidylyltransferase [Planctomycetota bacterium]|jgi:CDP-diglyceride synthetase
MTRERVIIAIVAFATVLGILYFDWRVETHLGSLVLITALGVLALSELFVLFRRVGLDSYPAYGVLCACVLFLWRGLGGYLGIDEGDVREGVLGLFAAVVAIPFLVVLFRNNLRPTGGREQFERAGVTLLGLLLVWFLFSFILELRLLRHPPDADAADMGLRLALVLALSVKLGDSAAYVVGRSFGVTPLTWVSPKKTWEGAAASVVGAVVVCMLLGLPLLGKPFHWWHMLLFGVLTNVAGQLGDLMESLVKRRSGAKDSGTFLREIGGFLDLIDSLLLAAPVGYLFVRLVVL